MSRRADLVHVTLRRLACDKLSRVPIFASFFYRGLAVEAIIIRSLQKRLYLVINHPYPHSPLPRATDAAQIAIISLSHNNAAQSCPAPLVPLEPIAASASSPLANSLADADERASRKDRHLRSTHWLLRAQLAHTYTGVIRTPCLQPFSMPHSSASVPATPRVISPSPTPSEVKEELQDGYFGPTTRSARKMRASAQAAIDEEIDEDSSGDMGRARSKSRSSLRSRKPAGLTAAMSATHKGTAASPAHEATNGSAKASNGHLSPASANSGWNWRDISRSPSPLGLIPIHRQWRSFVHKHEVPRKALHVSIGFLTIWLYRSGVQTDAITPYLIAGLIPIATVDYLRHAYPSLNRFYVRLVGILMRETEYDGWNGVIWYLLGAWIVLGFFPKDVGVMGVLLLSWCDTAASTVGRAFGRYTPRIRRNKTFAGSLAAFAMGVITAASFWGYLAPRTGPFVDDVDWPFMFTGTLSLPTAVRDAVGLTESQGSITGALALAVMSTWTGAVAAASEVVDIFGWDDNLTIPVLSGIGIWVFLKVFG